MNNLYELANEVAKAADIVEVVSHFIKLEKKGKDYVSLCPFHDDKTLGSFSVSPDKGIYKCFSCNAGGNAINFVQRYTHCNFPEAVKKTAEIIGFSDERLKGLVQEKPIDPKTQKLYECLSDISNFYSASLYQANDSEDALNYLHSRGLNDDVIKYFGIGYAQSNGENIINFLLKKGYSLQTISETGILNLSSTPYRDVNAGRIAFTITDKDNKVVGFSCRKFRENDKSQAKYINTSATKLFNKSSTLFNYYNALTEARKVGYVYILEGFMDVIACHRVGIKSAIALMGTALTKENIQLLRYLKCEIRVCLDLDGPGQLNTKRVAELLDEAKLKYQIVNNAVNFPYKDSDDILKNLGEEKLRSYLTNLISEGEWLLNYYTQNLNLNSLQNRKKFLSSMLPFLSELKSPLDLDDYITKINNKTGFTKQIINSYIKKYIKETHKKDTEAIEEIKKVYGNQEQKDVICKLQLAERQIVRYMLENKEAISMYQHKLGFFSEPDYRQIATSIEEFMVHSGTEEYNANSLITYLSTDECQIQNKDKIRNDISSILIEDDNIPPFSEENVNEIIETIKLEKSEKRIKQEFEISKEGKTDAEKAELAQLSIMKRKNLILENDKKRR